MTTDEEIFKRWKENQGGAWECPELIECNILECMKLAREDVFVQLKKNPCGEGCNIHCHAFEKEKVEVAKTKLENALDGFLNCSRCAVYTCSKHFKEARELRPLRAEGERTNQKAL